MRFLVLMLGFFIVNAAFAQGNLRIANVFTTKEGMSSNEITSVKQDSRGFLWIATREGLNRFDGFQFKKYFFEKNNPLSLTHNNIFDMLEYQYGQLLIATGNGLTVLNTLTGKFDNEKIKFAALRPGLGNTIQSLYKDKQGNIWVNHHGEIDVLDSNLNYLHRATEYGWGKSMKGALIGVEDWHTDGAGRIWFLSDTSGIHIIDLTRKEVFSPKNNPGNLPYLKYMYVRSFLVDEENNAVWYAPWGKALIRYDMDTKKEQHFSFGKNAEGELQTINNIARTREGNLLCGIGGEYFMLHSSTFNYTKVAQPASVKESMHFTSTAIQRVGEQYWIGNPQGLVLVEGKTAFTEISFAAEKDMGTGSSTDLCFATSGNLYCTYTDNKLVVADKNNHATGVYKLAGKNNIVISCIAEDGQRQIWVGSAIGLYLFDEKNKTFSQPGFLPDALRRNFVNKVFKDVDGSLWIGTRYPFSLYHYHPGKNSIERITNEAVNHFADFGNNSRISNFSADRYGNLWMTSRLGGGIVRFDKAANKWASYPPRGRNYEFFQKKGVTCMYADAGGNLWMSNFFRDGLIRYNYKTDSISLFTRSDGLLSDYILGIFGDNTGKLWLTSENGITAFNTKTLRTETNIALWETGEQPGASVNALCTQMAIGLQHSVLLINLSADSINSKLPVPLLDKVAVNNQQQFIKPGEALNLGYEQKNISIDFTAVDLSGDKTLFAYQLSGVDKDWKFTDAVRNAQYSILAPGRYSFMVKTGNDKGAWSIPYNLFSFTILPPWWRTWWFIFICIAVAGVLFFVWVKIREQNIRRRASDRADAQALVQEAQMQVAAQQHQMAEAEMLALRAQMNPHFLFNSLNSINNYILKNDAENAAGYLTKFSRLMRIILENSRSNWISLQNELKALELYVELEAFRFDNSFTYNIDLASNVNTDWASIPPMIIQPYAENAIWHGLMHSKKPGSHLQIDIYKKEDMLFIAIKDNGVGRQQSNRLKNSNTHTYKSHGMKITAERLAIMNKVYNINARVEVNDLSGDAETGTQVLIKLKYTFQSQPATA